MSGIAAPGGRRDDEPPNLDLAALHIVVADLFLAVNGQQPTNDEVLAMVAKARELARQQWVEELQRA